VGGIEDQESRGGCCLYLVTAAAVPVVPVVDLPLLGGFVEHSDTEQQYPPQLLLYTAEQAAALLQVSPAWLRRKAAARLVPCTFVGKHLRFTAGDLEAIIAAGRQESRGQRVGRAARRLAG